MSGTTTRPPPRWLLMAGGSLAAVAASLWAAAYLDRPFAQDHGIFAWGGDVIRAGGMPYRDAWDIKGPAPYAAFAMIQAVLGEGSIALRAVDLVILGVGAVLLVRLSRAMIPGAAWIAVLVLDALWYASLTYENTAQPDGWAAVVLLGVVTLLTGDERPGGGRLLTVGAMLGVCCLLKPTYLLCAAIPLAALLGTPRQGSSRGLGLLPVASGMAVPIAAAAGWLVWNDAFGDFVDVHLRYTASIYTAGRGLPGGFVTIGAELLGSPAFGLAFLTAVAGVIALFAERHRLRWTVLAWFASALTLVALGGKFFPYHWLSLYPPVAVLAVRGVTPVLRGLARRLNLPPPRTTVALTGAVILLAAGSTRRAAREAIGWWSTVSDPEPRARYELDRFGPEGRHETSLLAVAEYVRLHSSSGQTVQMFGQDALLYHVSDRFPPTRFGTSQPVLSGSGVEFRGRYREEFEREFSANPPLYVVSRRLDLCAQATRLRRVLLDCLEGYPEFRALVDSLYSTEEIIGDYLLWRLRAARPSDLSIRATRRSRSWAVFSPWVGSGMSCGASWTDPGIRSGRAHPPPADRRKRSGEANLRRDGAEDVRPVTHLANRVGAPAPRGAVVQCTGDERAHTDHCKLWVAENGGRHQDINQCTSRIPRISTCLPSGILSPTIGAAVGRQPAGGLAPPVQREENVASRHWDRARLIRRRPVTDLSTPVAAPAVRLSHRGQGAGRFLAADDLCKFNPGGQRHRAGGEDIAAAELESHSSAPAVHGLGDRDATGMAVCGRNP